MILKISNIRGDKIIPIGDAARSTGLSISALRKYERAGLIVFRRTGGNRRILTTEDVTRIQKIQYLIGERGLNLESILRLWALIPCWKLKDCPMSEQAKCPALPDPFRPCWMTMRFAGCASTTDCALCDVYLHSIHYTEDLKRLFQRLLYDRQSARIYHAKA